MFDFITIGTPTSQAKILTVDNVTILADPGWNGVDDLSLHYPSYVDKINIILLSQSTIEYIGAYAMLLYTYPRLREIPTYSTLPVAKLAKITTCELYRSIGVLGSIESNIIEINHISKYFNSIKSINYSQTLQLNDLSITAYSSGYSIGGSMWIFENKISEKIIYSPIWNHLKDKILNNCNIFNNKNLIRSTTYITNSEYTSSKLSYSSRIEKFSSLIEESFNLGKSIILPTSLTGRFFELLLNILANKKLSALQLYIINYTNLENLKILNNFLEWLNSNIIKFIDAEDEDSENKIFDISRIKTMTLTEFDNMLDVQSFKKSPKIYFLNDFNFIDSSLFNQFITSINSRLNYSIILTELPNINSKLQQFYNLWMGNDEGVMKDLKIDNFDLVYYVDEILRGTELSNYESKIMKRREAEKMQELERLAAINNLENDSDSDEDDDDDDDDENTNADNNIAEKDIKLKGADTGINSLEINEFKEIELKYTLNESKILKLNEILSLERDFNVSNLKHKNRVFPNVQFKFNSDDYGVVVNQDDFQIFNDDKFPIISDDINDDDNIDYDINDAVADADLDDIQFDEHGKRKRRTKSSNSLANKRRKSNNSINIISKDFDIDNSLDSLNNPITRTKHVKKTSLNFGFSFIDLSGNHDLRSLKYVVNQLKPRKVILLPVMKVGDGNVNNGKTIISLIDDVNKTKNTEILNASLNNQINLGNVITTFEILVDNKLVNSIHWKLLNNQYNIGFINGVVEKVKDWDYKLKPDQSDKAVIKAGIDTTTIEPSTSNSSTIARPTTIKIGDIKLTELRKILKSKLNNLSVEMLGDGRLVIDDEIIIMKDNFGNININGGLGLLFYKIKNIVNDMLATV